MVDIAADAGVTKPVLYRAFGSKTGLYQAVAEWFIEQFIADIHTLIAERRPLREFLDDVIEVTLAKVRDDENLYRFLLGRARLEVEVRSDSGPDYIHQLGETVGNLLAQHLRASGHDPAPAQVWGLAVVGQLSTVADWWLDHPEISLDQVVGQLGDLLWTGVQPYR